MRWGVYVFWFAPGVYVIWNIGTKSHFSDVSASAVGLCKQNQPTSPIALGRASERLNGTLPGTTRNSGNTAALPGEEVELSEDFGADPISLLMQTLLYSIALEP